MLPVSVIIPCYNTTSTLPWTLESIIAQTEKPAEVIIVDDGSKDDPGAMAETYKARLAPAKLVVVKQENRGLAGARNTGIAHATQPLLAFLDGDDCWLPTKLAVQARAFDDPGVVLSGTDFYIVRDLNPPRKRLNLVSSSKVQARVGDGARGLYGRNYLGASTTMVRAAVLQKSGLFDASLRVMEDHDLWQRVVRHGRVYMVPEPLLDYFDRPGSLSKKAGLMWKVAMLLAWRYRPDMPSYLKQCAHVTLRRVRNAMTKGPIVGGTPLPS